jgi:hypothetical protein
MSDYTDRKENCWHAGTGIWKPSDDDRVEEVDTYKKTWEVPVDRMDKRAETAPRVVEDSTKFQLNNWVRFQVLTAASVKFRVFWDVDLCSHVEADRCFRGAYCLHHQGDYLSQKTLNFLTFWVVELGRDLPSVFKCRLVAGIAGSNPAEGMDFCLLCLYVVLCCVGRDLCDGLITRPEESYRVCLNSVWLRNLKGIGQGPIWALEPLDGWIGIKFPDPWRQKKKQKKNKQSKQ